VMMTALLIIATAGEGAAAMATGKWATVLRVLRAADALGDVTTYVGKAARLPSKAVTTLRRRFGKGADVAEEVAESAAVKEGQHLAGEATDAGSRAEAPVSHGGGEQPAGGKGVAGGKYGVDPDSGIDLLTDPHPPPEVLNARRTLKSASDFSLQHDAKDAFRKLVREFLARRAQEVDAVLNQLKHIGGTGFSNVSHHQMEEIFDYLFNSHGIELNYSNYAAWRRVAIGRGTVDDLRFLRHELEELKLLHEGGLQDVTGRGVPEEQLYEWQRKFLHEHYLPAHRKALDAELEFLGQEIERLTKGHIRLSTEEVAMSDLTRSEGREYALRDDVSIEEHEHAEKWNRRAEKARLSPEIARSLGISAETSIGEIIQAVKASLAGSAQ
jgi:hypothetical protein